LHISAPEWLDSTPAADKVHDDGYQGEDEQQVDQEATDVQDEESAKPKQNQDHCKNQKHEETFFLRKEWRARRRYIKS
jgi:hypothetical protein